MELVVKQQKIAKLSNAYRAAESDSTPLALAQQVVSKIPEEVIKNKDSKFLDPCAGTGTFLVALFERLSEHHNAGHIMNNMLYGFDITATNNKILTKKLGFVNITRADFLTTELDMKFDVIIGNPPYQKDSKAKRWTLWSEFTKKGIKDTNSNLLFVIPNSWLGPNSEHEMIFEHLKFADLDAGRYFSVGSTFSYIHLDKNFTETPTIKSSGNLYQVSRLNKFLPNNQEFIPINNKFFRGDRFDFVRTTEHHTSKKDKWGSEDGIYKVFHTNAQTLYSSVAPNRYDYNSYKAYITLSGYPEFKVEKDISFSQAVAWCNVNEEEVEYIESILSSKLYNVMMEQNKWSGWNSLDVIKELPKPPLDKVYSDEDLYNYFEFTEAEIQLIENN